MQSASSSVELVEEQPPAAPTPSVSSTAASATAAASIAVPDTAAAASSPSSFRAAGGAGEAAFPVRLKELQRLEDENAVLRARLAALEGTARIDASLLPPPPPPARFPASITEKAAVSVSFLHCSQRTRRHLEELLPRAELSTSSSSQPLQSGSVTYYQSFCLDTQGCPLAAQCSPPYYTAPVLSLPLPLPSSLPAAPSLQQILAALSVCFNCGRAAHVLAGCPEERDGEVIRANSGLYRQYAMMRERERGARDEERKDRQDSVGGRDRYYHEPAGRGGSEAAEDERKAEQQRPQEVEEGEVDEEGRTEQQQILHRLRQQNKRQTRRISLQRSASASPAADRLTARLCLLIAVADVSAVVVVDETVRSAEQLRLIVVKRRAAAAAAAGSDQPHAHGHQSSSPSFSSPSPASPVLQPSSRKRGYNSVYVARADFSPPRRRSASPTQRSHDSQQPSRSRWSASPPPASSSNAAVPSAAAVHPASAASEDKAESERPTLPAATAVPAAHVDSVAAIKKWTPQRRKVD